MNVGDKFARLTVMALGARTKKSKMHAICACECGRVALVKDHYRLIYGTTRSCGCLLTESRRAMGLANIKPEVDSDYLRAHARVRALKGNAKNYKCIQCGGQASEWSYDGGCPDERTEVRADGRPGIKPRTIRFSMDPWRYLARCHSCHLKHDIVGKNYAKELQWLL